ncbi:hypothetical protein Q3G72_002418 [Acer saccharum]|nr:hypothetical protein Q3G72_002418 [Acer saccharum]
MWKHDFKQLDLILQNLEVLDICDCNSLINRNANISSEDYSSDSSSNLTMEMLQEDIELNKATQQLDEKAVSNGSRS